MCSCGETREPAFARNIPRTFISQGPRIDTLQEILAAAEQDRPDGEIQLIDQPDRSPFLDEYGELIS
jgi:hypothetical protein